MLIGPKLAVLVSLTIAWDPTAPVSALHGYQTGNGYLQMPDSQRNAYVMGLFDGFMSSTIIGGDVTVAERVKSCMSGMKSNQVMVIFDKYLRDKPPAWHEDSNILFLQAISHVCPGAIWPAQNIPTP